jgi:cell division protein FtsI/penicillin-binding protein 2
MRQQYAVRSLILVAFFAIAGIAVITQMIRIQSSTEAQLFLSQGARYSGEFQVVYPERGEIYDRNGHLLAGNRTVYEVGVSLKEMEDPQALAYTLATYLGLQYEDVHDQLVNAPETWEYVVVQDYVGAETVTSLQELIKQMIQTTFPA